MREVDGCQDVTRARLAWPGFCRFFPNSHCCSHRGRAVYSPSSAILAVRPLTAARVQAARAGESAGNLSAGSLVSRRGPVAAGREPLGEAGLLDGDHLALRLLVGFALVLKSLSAMCWTVVTSGPNCSFESRLQPSVDGRDQETAGCGAAAVRPRDDVLLWWSPGDLRRRSAGVGLRAIGACGLAELGSRRGCRR